MKAPPSGRVLEERVSSHGEDVAQPQERVPINGPARPPEGRVPFLGEDVAQRQEGTSMQHFYWRGQPIPYRDGETLALALRRAHVHDFGPAAGGQQGRYFCGIGQCQACLVSVNGGVAVESCLTPAQALAVVTPGAF